MNRVSEALKGKKVNQACQAWMGWMPPVLWYDDPLLSLPDTCFGKHAHLEPAEGSHFRELARPLVAFRLTPPNPTLVICMASEFFLPWFLFLLD